jgi:hypothetical protein
MITGEFITIDTGMSTTVTGIDYFSRALPMVQILPNQSEVTSTPVVEGEKITLEFYFNHVKGNFSRLELATLSKRFQNLRFHLEGTVEEQVALKQELERLAAIVYLQQQLLAIGFDLFVTRNVINEFMYKVEIRSPQLMELEKFPRILPDEAIKRLKEAKETKLFDKYWVLTWNPHAEQLKTMEEKITSKDPILFGQVSFDPDKFYHIADWEDEHCDLTLDKFIEVAQINETPSEVNAEDLLALAKARVNKIQSTNVNNYKFRAIVERLSNEKLTVKKTLELIKTLISIHRKKR